MKKVLDPIQDTKWVYKACALASADGKMVCCKSNVSCNNGGHCTCHDGSTPTEHAGGGSDDNDDDSVKSSDGSDDDSTDPSGDSDNTCGEIGFNKDKCEATPGCKWFSPAPGLGMCHQ